MDGEMRICKKCKEAKPIDDFYLKRSNTCKSGFHRKLSCKLCDSARARQWAKDNTAQATRTRWLRDLRDKYGMTEQDWDVLFEKQGGVCAICREGETSVHRSGTLFRLSVDHCHDTMRVRGILCNNCNRAIGLLKDNAALLRKAALYLEE